MRYWIISFILLTMSCEQNKKIEVQGHRGCKGLLPENSLPAFKKAIELGVETLEMDIVISRDEKVVVSHEAFMNHKICKDPLGDPISENSEKEHNLFKMDYEKIKAYDCGTAFHPDFPNQELIQVRKPLLSEVFELAEGMNPEIKYNIELKSAPELVDEFCPKPEIFVRLVLELIDADQFDHRINLQSFDLTILEEIKKQRPEMAVALLVDEDEDIELKLGKLSFKPEIISPNFKLLSHKMVNDYQNSGFQVIPWTVNEEDDMLEMMSFQVDAIITDYPGRLIEILKGK